MAKGNALRGTGSEMHKRVLHLHIHFHCRQAGKYKTARQFCLGKIMRLLIRPMLDPILSVMISVMTLPRLNCLIPLCWPTCRDSEIICVVVRATGCTCQTSAQSDITGCCPCLQDYYYYFSFFLGGRHIQYMNAVITTSKKFAVQCKP